jgi:uncharacterized protein
MQDRLPVCVFVKPPRPGTSKTRLIPAVGAHGAVCLAGAFLEDTWSFVRSLRWAHPVLVASDEDDALVALASDAPLWLQGEGDLGARLERVLRRALGIGQAAIAVGADSPGLPRRLMEQMRAALVRHDAVLGPAEDGGFYAVGLRRCPKGVFAGVPWSTGDTFRATVDQMRGLGLNVAVIEPWFDVDRPQDLARLARLLAGGLVSAPATRQTLEELGLGLDQQQMAWSGGKFGPC